ncbi:hypothetical protein J4E85_007265 [Alternaria conjuncta]|uniref:uncharacterized protein n=1 Tax=Alternaria conjuncta TaxID=181017 RepID=UPI0022201DBA|nr:uncharacterized protein J4E85_007265 [Alternaria conjuncta]KAI4925386.1 hypothetical protein J4E85_007265 [Alternaria conjuncta]
MFYYDPLYNSTRTDRWHDLSQLSISPYLEALLTADDQIKHRLGRWEITLRPSSSLKTLVFNDDFATKVVLNNIGSLQVTNPPCRALGLYHDDPGGSVAESTRLLVRVKNDNGVSIAEFAHALQYAAPTTHEAWMANANHLVNKIRRSPRSHDIWHIPGAPTIRVHLDNVSMPESGDPVSYGLHPNRYAQMKAEPDRRSREMAWISEDLLEPTGAIVDRDPIDWDEWGDVLKLME